MACNASHQTVFGTGDTQSEPATSSASEPQLCTCEYYVERTEKSSHFATMPPELAERCIKAGTKPGDMVLDPFGGAGTTGLVADRLNRNATLIELNPAYRGLAAERITADAPLFAGVK
jgi:DNA modification methylase